MTISPAGRIHPGFLIRRASVVVVLGAVTSATVACSAFSVVPSDSPPPPPHPECLDDSYDFEGEGTLAALGLENATPAVLPDVDRPARIRVTHAEFATPHFGGSARMLCFEFGDGTGGTEWPVDPAWQPPGVASSPETGADGPPILLIAVGALLLIGLSALAFRRSGTAR